MAFDGTYYKVYEFYKVYFQSNSTGTIVETEFPWPNALKPAYETQDYEWQGGATKKKVTALIAANWTLDLDAIPLSAHATLFTKAEITDAGAADAYFDVSTMVGFGGGNDVSGVSRGMRAVAYSYAGATDTPVHLNIWAPVATITLGAIGGLSTGNIGDKTTYNISATKTLVDITGATITGGSADGELFYIGEVT
jgi:hypothetical protein